IRGALGLLSCGRALRLPDGSPCGDPCKFIFTIGGLCCGAGGFTKSSATCPWNLSKSVTDLTRATYQQCVFYERAAALYHHARGTPPKRLFWVAVRGGRWRIDWPRTNRTAPPNLR